MFQEQAGHGLWNLTTQETDTFLQTIENFKQSLSNEDEDQKSVIASLNHVTAKLAQVQLPSALGNVSAMKHVAPLYEHDFLLTFSKAKIQAGLLSIISNKISELHALGLREGVVGRNQMKVNQTRDLIYLIRAHVSFSTKAGCRILVNVILLHVVSDASGVEADVSIIPEFRMDSTRFEYAAISYGDVVDFLIVKGPPASIKFLLDGPQLAFTNPNMIKHLSSNIYQAKRDRFRDAIPQAVMIADNTN